MKLSCLVFLFLGSYLQDPGISVKDLKPALGSWKGTITYKDYTSGKPFTMPANMVVEKDKSNEQRLILRYEYPKEPTANANDTLVFSADKKQINGELVISKENTAGGILKVITEKTGVDGNDNRPALFKTYLPRQ
ncbi:MAG TPA: hypothetical protein VMZ03_11630 [Chitinophagaceae bacterium]|nr:hypothetical protein [Chitinophagaceae bacterium]